MAYIQGLPITTYYGSPLILNDQGVLTFANPNQYVWLYDDFVGGISNSALQWQTTLGGTSSIGVQTAGITSGHPGVINLNCGGSFASAAMNLSNGSNLGFILGGGRIIMNFVVKLAALSAAANRNTILIGIMDTFNSTSAANGVYFSYVDNANSGKWQVVTTASSTPTTTNTTSTADTNFHRFTIDINAAASSVTFYIDGTSVGTNAAHIPSGAIAPALVVANGGTYTSGSQAIYYDMFSYYQNLTTPR